MAVRDARGRSGTGGRGLYAEGEGAGGGEGRGAASLKRGTKSRTWQWNKRKREKAQSKRLPGVARTLALLRRDARAISNIARKAVQHASGSLLRELLRSRGRCPAAADQMTLFVFHNKSVLVSSARM